MIGAAAGVGGEAADLRPVDLRRERRRQLVGDQHRRLVELAQQVARRLEPLAQVHLEPADQVGDVAAPLPQVRIGHLVEHRAELVEHLLHRPLRVDALLAHDLDGSRDDHRVVEHQQLRVEQRGDVGSAPPRHVRADVRQLLPRAAPALLQARQLVLDAARRDLVAKHLRPLNQNDRAPRDDARGDADAGQASHAGSSPKPDSTSAVSAATASCSSAPSAVIVMVDPHAAASSRIPMMLLPSICRPSRTTRTCDWNRVARWTNFAAARACMPS